MNLYLKTLAGLEDLAAEELKAAGATHIEVGRRGISFQGDAKVLYTVCMHSRFAVRVLRYLTSFEAKTPDDLYRQGARFAWENMLEPDGSFVIDATVHSDGFSHSHFAALKLKDAIVDRFRGKTGKRPSIDKVRPDLRLNLHISGEKVTISVDALRRATVSSRVPSPDGQGAAQRSLGRWLARLERVASRHAPLRSNVRIGDVLDGSGPLGVRPAGAGGTSALRLHGVERLRAGHVAGRAHGGHGVDHPR